MMREEDKKKIVQQKVERKMLTDNEKRTILGYLFDNLKKIPRDGAINILKEYRFTKKEIDFIKECYANN